MADDTEPSQVKKKINPGPIDVHPTENAIVINYYADKKPMQKTIRVKSLGPNTNIPNLAREIIDKCKLVSASRQRDIEQTLYYLQQRQLSDSSSGTTLSPSPNTLPSDPSIIDASNRAWLKKQLEDARQQEEATTMSRNVKDEPSSMDNMEHYIEGLYEEIPDKIASTQHILQLARVPENMDLLMANESLISALSRVLREDNKKSMDLVTNIMYIFFCFSNYSQFHSFITSNKVGDMCLRITDQELNRFNLWVQDLEKLENKCHQSPGNATLAKELDQEHRKFQAMIKKQDQLLFVCFHLLLNLAEDLNIEVKMIKRDIVNYLLHMLDRKTPELLVLVMTFLKKLSIFKENKDELVKNMDELLNKLDRIIPCENQGLQNLTLRLLLNLSHDQKFRLGLVRHGFLEKLVETLNGKNHVLLTIQLLYQISVDDANREAFAQTDAIPLLIKMILEYKGEKVNVELMAVAINIATSQRCAQIICEDNGLKFLMKRALKTRDTLLLKMLRNVCDHDGEVKMMFLDYIDDLMHLMLKSLTSTDVMVEVLGILASLNIPDFDFAKLAQAYGLLELIQKRVSLGIAEAAAAASQAGVAMGASIPGQAGGKAGAGAAGAGGRGGLTKDDDVLLEVINLLGTMANDENIAPMVARTEIITLLMDLMIAKEEDDEIILQIIYCIYQFLLHDSTRNILITKTQVVSYLIDLLYDRNVQIRKMCDVCLDIISEIDEEWVSKIKQQKFQWHNAEYLSILAAGVNSPNHETGDEDTNPMMHTDDEESEYNYGRSETLDAALGRRDTAGHRGSKAGVGGFDDDSDDEIYGGRLIGGTSALLDGP
ncbi:Kinesin-associated protein 3 [Chytridiales sp. JEL 0842]|nr:Kinesin-associated protein 3 [Chytridiales sp. JEL 0842]